MWSSDVNDPKLLDAFPSLLEKDLATKGDFGKDYESICESNGIIRCPFITGYSIGEEDGKEGIRIANGVIDLPSWRAMLLSLATVGSKVVEIAVHSCTLSSQHIIDLGKALAKSGLVKSLKIQYSQLYNPTDDNTLAVTAFKALLVEATNIEFISFKNNNLTNEVVQGFSAALSENFRLQGLALCQNNLSDETIMAVLQAIKFNPNYRVLNFSNNCIDGLALVNALVNQYIGVLSTANEDSSIKAMVKSLNDRNKAVKDVNKKRKKANLIEFSEFPNPPEFSKPYEGKQQYFANRCLEYLDLRKNSINSNFFTSLSEAIQAMPNAVLSDVKIKILLSNPQETNVAELPESLLSFLEFC